MPEFLRSVHLLGVALAIVTGVVFLLFAAAWRWRRRPLWPSPPTPLIATWTGGEILAAFLLFLMMPPLVTALLQAMGFFTFVYGPDFPIVPPPDAEITAEELRGFTLRHLWSTLIALPIQLLILGYAMREMSRTRPSDLGLSLRTLPGAIPQAGITWLVITPMVFVIFILANVVFWWIARLEPDAHPLTQFGTAPGWLTWVLLGMQVLLCGPILEEIIFRGLLQPWIGDHPERRLAVMVGAFLIALTFGMTKVDVPNWVRYAPAMFVLAMCAVPMMLPSRPAFTAAFISALLFAAFHSSVWPTPFPLLVLGLGLSWLRWRSGTLWAPILVHAGFNAVSYVYLAIGGK